MEIIFDIQPVQLNDVERWSELRQALWPGSRREDLQREAVELLGNANVAILLARTGDRVIGFIEVSIRSTAEGCVTSPVAFIEGWFVCEEYRKCGVGRRLMDAATDWARARGCTELGSDTELSNVESQRAHRAMGFEELPPAINFFKAI